ncbi:hypothetical protein N9W35_05510, partial [Flavobacteriaceae bacterium]|nr:hypothetical protein [Flavobacteriaceae bacterium]
TALGLGTADNVTFNNVTGNLIGNILDSNGNELVKGSATASAVNEITVTNAAIGNGPTISASGDDTDIDLNIEAKGTGVVNTSGDLTVGGAMDVTGSTSMAAINSDGVVTLSNNTTSSSSSTGALKVTGGVGVAENLNVGGTIDVTGSTSMAAISSDGVVTLSNNTTSTSSTTGALKVTGGVGVAENLNVGGALDVTGDTNLNSTTTSTSSSTGALIVDGGVGVAENLNVGGAIDVTDAATTRNNLGIYTGTTTYTFAANIETLKNTPITISDSNVNIGSKIIITASSASEFNLYTGTFYVNNIINSSFDILNNEGIDRSGSTGGGTTAINVNFTYLVINP